MATPLTKEEKAAYLKNSGKCPKCKSDKIDAGSIEHEDDKIYQPVKCFICEFQWYDEYTLTGIQDGGF